VGAASATRTTPATAAATLSSKHLPATDTAPNSTEQLPFQAVSAATTGFRKAVAGASS